MTMPCLLATGVLAFTACTNDKYDLSDIDSTVGVGGEIVLPSSSIRQIQLDDLFDLANTESVAILDNGDYVFEQQGTRVAAAHPVVEKITVQQESVTELPVALDMSGLPTELDDLPVGTEIIGTRGTIGDISEPARSIQEFEYRGLNPDAVRALTSADISGTIHLNLTFTPDLQTYIQQFNNLDLKLPPYMKLNKDKLTANCKIDYIEDSNTLHFENVNTLTGIAIEADLPELDFTRTDSKNQLEISGDSIIMSGVIEVAGDYPDCVKRDGRRVDLNNFRINSEMTISELTLNSAVGKFSPEIELDDIGGMVLDDLPDFLTDDNVVADLYNPQIIIKISNDMAVPGIVDGKLIAKDANGNVISEVPVTDMNINPVTVNNGISEILLCRTTDGVNIENYTDVVEVPDLSNIIMTIPDNITFEVNARADASEECEFELGHQYTIEPSYRLEAPLAFARGARIVYNDVIDGWNDSLDDIDITDDTEVHITANIENCIPAYLVLNAYAIDKDGRELSDFDIDIDKTIAASEDGITRAKTPMTIIIKQKTPNAMKKLDGLKFTISAQATDDAAKAVEGITLNAYRHSLLVNDIKIKVIGKVIFSDNND